MISHKKLFSLQIVRALAAWTVVFHHYVQLYLDPRTATGIAGFLWTYGALGVDVFFVLSGFVMCLLLQKSEKGPAHFLIDRVFRIAPTYWFWTAIVVACLFIFPRGFSYTDYNLETLVKTALFIPTQNPSGLGLYPVLTVGWTLNFEMFFYAALACSMAFSRRWALAIFLILFALLPYVYPYSAPFSAIARDPRMHEFWAGAVLALAWNKHLASTSRKFPKLSLAAGFTCVFVSTVLFTGESPIAFALSIVVFALFVEHYLRHEWLPVRVFVHLGELSYSTYLAHCVVIGIAIHLSGKGLVPYYQLIMLLATVLGTYAASAMSYRWLENSRYIATWRAAAIQRIGQKANVPEAADAYADTRNA